LKLGGSLSSFGLFVRISLPHGLLFSFLPGRTLSHIFLAQLTARILGSMGREIGPSQKGHFMVFVHACILPGFLAG